VHSVFSVIESFVAIDTTETQRTRRHTEGFSLSPNVPIKWYSIS
jgi:hypothetical protein